MVGCFFPQTPPSLPTQRMVSRRYRRIHMAQLNENSWRSAILLLAASSGQRRWILWRATAWPVFSYSFHEEVTTATEKQCLALAARRHVLFRLRWGPAHRHKGDQAQRSHRPGRSRVNPSLWLIKQQHQGNDHHQHPPENPRRFMGAPRTIPAMSSNRMMMVKGMSIAS